MDDSPVGTVGSNGIEGDVAEESLLGAKGSEPIGDGELGERDLPYSLLLEGN